MNSEALKTAILEWQKRHGIADNDPILASLELWEIYLNRRPPERTADPPSFLEFRSSLEALDALAKRLSRQMTELQQEIRAGPARDQHAPSASIAVILWIAASGGAGIFIGKFVL